MNLMVTLRHFGLELYVLIIVPTVFMGYAELIDEENMDDESYGHASHNESDHNDDNYDNDETNDNGEEEECAFEAEDEEAMIERAYELCHQSSAAGEEADDQDTESQIEVQHDHGQTHTLSVSKLEELNSDGNIDKIVTLSNKDNENTTTISTTPAPRPVPPSTTNDRSPSLWKVTKIGSNSLVRARTQNLQD
ncbi:hypothetical protein CC86DRAFT_28176 [Ophiobolus disseminans]|uniref:Uncharacterized protein n=1 Tax=Ophiobolus disseminans TaxID=1469910 RepID=A0A6A6ZZR5_9PLEO|nr:hypothetical protein CC86DRAFT_28176 [Ophiobolus disseminans]